MTPKKPKIKTLQRLRPTEIAGLLQEVGKHADGGSLYLQVRAGRLGKGAWVFQRRENGKLRSHGLGPCPPVTLMDARKSRAAIVAATAREWIPPALRQAARTDPARPQGELFGEVAAAYVKAYGSEWKDGGARARTLLRNAAPLDKRRVDRITDEDVADVLRPIWTGPGGNKGSKLRGLIEQILASAKVKDNPATWAKQKHCKLIRTTAQTSHHPSLPWLEVPALMGELAAISSVQARAIRFTVLTAARQSETLGAQWGEIDLAAKTWTVPAERMKPTGGKKKPHTVPLNDAAIKCLGEAGTGYVFPIGRTAVRRLLQTSRPGITLHGFRSSFTDWAAEAGYPSELREMALAHAVGDAVEQAYLRTKLIDPRREMMDAWAKFAAQ